MAGDASWSSVALLLHGEGANNATAFVDSSPRPKTLTSVGGAKISTAHAIYGASSLFFDGADDYIAVTDPANTGDLNLNGVDYTLELFAYLTSLASIRTLISNFTVQGAGRFYLAVGTAGELSMTEQDANGSNSASAASAAGVVPLNTDLHLAATKQGTTLRLFVGGTLVATGTSAARSGFTTSQLTLGKLDTGVTLRPMAGYMDEVRVTKGLARYTASFSAPAAPFHDGMGQVSGTVKDGVGSGLARTVRAYRRDTGALVANGASDAAGNFSLYTPTLDEVNVIALDDAAGTMQNDLIARAIPA